MKENSLISVIVPVYNVEKYIYRCLDSILAQTYKNLQIILVDDGATDNSGKICDQYAQKDNRVSVIHKPNGGLSDARNVGIEKAVGEFIAFIDSDDYIDSKYIEVLYHILSANNADISISNYERVLEDEDCDASSYNEGVSVQKFTKLEALKMLYDEEHKYQFTTAWGKLIKRNVISNIRFPKGRNYEDTATTHKFFGNAQCVVYTNRKQYYYLVRMSSITKSEKHIKDDAILAVRDRVTYFESMGDVELVKASWKQYIITAMGVFAKISAKDKVTKARKNGIYTMIKNEYMEHTDYLNEDWITRVRICGFLLFPTIYSGLLRRIKK